MKLFCIKSDLYEPDYIQFADCKWNAIYDYADFVGVDKDYFELGDNVHVLELPTPEQILNFIRLTDNGEIRGPELFTADDLREIALYCARTDEQYETIEKLF